jgi:ankyrin repeat protein
VQLGADVHAADGDGDTPLHTAAYNGHVEAMQALVELGADVHAADADGRTPLHAAAAGGHVEVVTTFWERTLTHQLLMGGGRSMLRHRGDMWRL